MAVGIAAVVLAVAAIGAGTYAAFSDTESGPDGTIAAGTPRPGGRSGPGHGEPVRRRRRHARVHPGRHVHGVRHRLPARGADQLVDNDRHGRDLHRAGVRRRGRRGQRVCRGGQPAGADDGRGGGRSGRPGERGRAQRVRDQRAAAAGDAGRRRHRDVHPPVRPPRPRRHRRQQGPGRHDRDHLDLQPAPGVIKEPTIPAHLRARRPIRARFADTPSRRRCWHSCSSP
ncbi:SipW-dependent-type signal peptide-containing protein [Pseudonocardia sp. S2-4]|uniref:SipW-dependent-type signal peptide-containing protein n=1 Tax=Pseudonocardia humida TaxID=2800819 RepID=A0ABT1ADK7_9PSEU|nr:SipW-dependent-type signal peptide-containing protein [Pseudonocardia humida]